MKISDIYQLYIKSYTVSTDTRNLEKDCMFFALQGESFNANKFAEKALSEGAAHVIIDDKAYYKNDSRYILVKSVLETLQSLAAYHRKKLGIPILALTGSNGKTTTKELVNVVMSTKYATVATTGNLNNHIGVPLTLLSMNPNTEFGIVEMGANHFDEIARLCEITQPNYGYITNFGKAHLEGFGSLEGVIKAKTELYQYLDKSNGIAFVNHLDAIQLEKSENQKRHCIGANVKNIESQGFVQVQFDTCNLTSNLLGSYNFFNLMAAIVIGQYFEIPNEIIKGALESYVPNNKRSELIKKGSTQFILDAYNANPTSMRAALMSFQSDVSMNIALILGDMFELGKDAAIEHQHILNLVLDLGFKDCVLIGKNFYATSNVNAAVKKYEDFTAFEKEFCKTSYENKTVLIKGSRGMALERVLELFE